MKYRFKTQDEFIRDGQWEDDNHCPLGWSLSGEMNHYLGQDVPEGVNENCDLRARFNDGGWWFESTNYVLKESSDITFYVQYCPEFTEDLYNALMEWCRINCKETQIPRGWKYLGLVYGKYFIFTDNYYGADNNNQGVKQEYTIDQVKSLIGYTVSEIKPIVSEDYTGRWIKALVDNPRYTGIKLGEVIKIIGKPSTYRLNKTSAGCTGMSIECPLNTSQWELVEEPKDDTKLSSFPSSGAILIEECDNLKEFKNFLLDCGKVSNSSDSTAKYLAWNETSFWRCVNNASKTIYKWNQLKHFVTTKKDDSEDILEKARRLYPIGTEFISNLGSFSAPTQKVSIELSWYDDTKEAISHTGIGWVYFHGKWAEIVKPAPSKVVPGYVRCVHGLMNAKVGKIYPVVDEEHCLCEQGNTYVWHTSEFTPATKQEYDAQFVKLADVYPINTEVRIKSDSDFLSQGTFNGERIKGIIICNKNGSYTYRVEWSNGEKNAYRPIDLELWKEESPEIKDPLYICKQEYRKGMKVKSASKTGSYTGEFIITEDPKEFRYLSGDKNIIDYSCSKGYLYYKGEYAEILEEGIYDISEIIETNKPFVDSYLENSGFAKSNPEAYNWLMDKPKPSIETVHSVDVNLRTKKQINKFKF